MTTPNAQAPVRTPIFVGYDQDGEEMFEVEQAEACGPLPKGMGNFDESLLPKGWDEPDYEAGNAYRARTSSPSPFLTRVRKAL